MTTDAIAQLILGESYAIREVRTRIARVAASPLPVLVQGPTGAGKELVAAALHAASGRSGQFVPFNVCAIADTMFEDALFGHVRGAFSGAVGTTRGFLREADRGTVLLDEISGLPLPAQAKLLRALETRVFRPVGGREDARSDFRLVSATNDDLRALVRDGCFRADLFQRVAGATIHIPPLAERPEDIPPLVRHFAARAGGATGRGVEFTEGALRLLQESPWPGNVRELKHVVDYVVVTAAGAVIGRRDVATALAERGADAPAPASSLDIDAHARREMIALLATVGWDTARAAAMLGVHRTSVYRRMKQLRIQPPKRGMSRDTADGKQGHIEAIAQSRANSREFACE